jgi:hypothetical protein
MEWTKEWPKEKGEFWFYGWAHRRYDVESMLYCEPEISLVKVRGTAIEGSFAYIAGSHFIYEKQAIGVWKPAELPEVPENIDDILNDKT